MISYGQLKMIPFWEMLRGEVMGKLKKNHKVWSSVGVQLIWPTTLSTLGSTSGRRSACIWGNIRLPPKLMSHLAAVSRRTSDLPCNMNPALLLLGLFFFFTWQQMAKHIHTRSLTLMLQHPKEPSRLLSQLFLFFTSNFYSSNTSFLTPQGCTWKWLLFRPYLTGKRPLLHKCGSKIHLGSKTIVPFPN